MASKILLPNQPLFPVNTSVADANGNIVKLSTDDAQKLQLSNAFLSVRAITSSCFAIQNTMFNEVTPKPDWYDGLNTKFLLMKDYAALWLNNYSIALTSTIPSSVLSFVPTYAACSDVITGIVGSNPGTLTPTQISTISSVLTRIIDKVEEITATVSLYVKLNDKGESEGKLIDWSKNVVVAQTALESGNSTVQKASSTLAAQVSSLNAEITKLQGDIRFYDKLVATGAAMVGGGAFVGAVGGAVCLANPIAGGITLFIGVSSLIAGAAIWGVYQGKINDANKKILADRASITADNKTLVALNTLSGACASVVENAKTATANLNTFATSWNVFGGVLKQTLAALNDADKDVQKSGLDVLLDMSISQKHWQTVNDYANQLIAAPSEVATVDANEAHQYAKPAA